MRKKEREREKEQGILSMPTLLVDHLGVPLFAPVLPCIHSALGSSRGNWWKLQNVKESVWTDREKRGKREGRERERERRERREGVLDEGEGCLHRVPILTNFTEKSFLRGKGKK
jgi:hypothetical protein